MFNLSTKIIVWLHPKLEQFSHKVSVRDILVDVQIMLQHSNVIDPSGFNTHVRHFGIIA